MNLGNREKYNFSDLFYACPKDWLLMVLQDYCGYDIGHKGKIYVIPHDQLLNLGILGTGV